MSGSYSPPGYAAAVGTPGATGHGAGDTGPSGSGAGPSRSGRGSSSAGAGTSSQSRGAGTGGGTPGGASYGASVTAAGRQAASWLREERAQAQARDPYYARRASAAGEGQGSGRPSWSLGGGAEASAIKPGGGGRGGAYSEDNTLLGSAIVALDTLPPPAEWPAALFGLLVVQPTMSVARALLAFVTSPRTHRVVLRLGVLTTLLWTALFLAMVAYIGFVRVWLPQVGLRKTVWLQYG